MKIKKSENIKWSFFPEMNMLKNKEEKKWKRIKMLNWLTGEIKIFFFNTGFQS